jgi:hypothetical protein
MSLLDDLKSIDVSGIVSARGSLRASISSAELTSLLESGASKAALGELGHLLDGLQRGDPGQLVKPLAGALQDLAGAFHFDHLPLGDHLTSVSEGVSLVAKLLDGMNGDLGSFVQAAGAPLGEALVKAAGGHGDFMRVAGEGIAELHRLVEIAERGLPGDPAAVAQLLLEVVLPVPGGVLEELADAVARVHTGAAALALAPQRASGLTQALDAVTAAALAGDEGRLRGALQLLDQVRQSTLSTLRGDLLQIGETLRALDPASLLQPVLRAEAALRAMRHGLLEFLDELRRLVARARTTVEAFDPAELASVLPGAVQLLEDFLRKSLFGFIDEQVDRAVAWFRGLFAHLPIIEQRLKLGAFFHSLAHAISDADVGRYARDAHALLQKIRDTVSPAALAAKVQNALKAADQAIGKALDGVIGALATIGTQVNAVADTAHQVLGRAVPALTEFNAAVTEIQAGVEGVGVRAAGEAIVSQLEKLRDVAEKLLTQAPLPEPLRDQVGQVVNVIKGLDLDAAFAPVRTAASQFKLPGATAAKIDDGLKQAAQLVENLIPAALIQSIDDEVQGVLDTISHFNPLALLPDLGSYLGTAAGYLEKLAPSPSLIDEVHQPFQKLLDLIDDAQPLTLLAPAIDAYDGVMSGISIPKLAQVIEKGGSLLSFGTDKLAGALDGPLQKLGATSAVTGASGSTPPTGSGSTGSGSTGSGSGGSGSTVTPAPAPPASSVESIPANLKPGDIIRMLGYLPGKLSQGLKALDASAAGGALRAVDRVTGGLARDLRSVGTTLSAVEGRVLDGLDGMLAPLGEKQLTAQLAIRAQFSGGGFDVSVAMAQVAQAGPGELRHALQPSAEQLRREVHHAASGTVHGVGESLVRTADALEQLKLSGALGDVEALVAALDPEPFAAEVDALVAAVVKRLPQVVGELGDAMEQAILRLRALILHFNPGTMVQRLLRLIDVVQEQLDLFNPRRLAAELGEIHAAIRATLVAYDPGAFLGDLARTVDEIAKALRTLDPATLVGDVGFLKTTVDKIKACVPTTALAGVGTQLEALGAQLEQVDLQSLLASVEQLGPQIVDAFEQAAGAIRQEIVALLESLRYANASASASVEVHG